MISLARIAIQLLVLNDWEPFAPETLQQQLTAHIRDWHRSRQCPCTVRGFDAAVQHTNPGCLGQRHQLILTILYQNNAGLAERFEDEPGLDIKLFRQHHHPDFVPGETPTVLPEQRRAFEEQMLTWVLDTPRIEGEHIQGMSTIFLPVRQSDGQLRSEMLMFVLYRHGQLGDYWDMPRPGPA